MNRRDFLKRAAVGGAGLVLTPHAALHAVQPLPPFFSGGVVSMPLLAAGVVDRQGDCFTVECLQTIVEKFNGSLPVTEIFMDDRPSGSIVSLRIDNNQLVADVELNDRGANLASAGFELAVGGVGCRGSAGEINKFSLSGAALTDSKVK